MEINKYISIFAVAILFTASSCTKIAGDLVEREKDHSSSSDEVVIPEASMFVIDTEGKGEDGITDPDNDESFDKEDKKVVSVN